MQNADRDWFKPDHLGTAGEPDTEKLVRPVRRETPGNLPLREDKASGAYPMKKASLLRCLLCGRLTLQHCAYCKEPICKDCQTFSHGKAYCTPQHRNMDTGIGRLLRSLEQSMR